MSSRIPPSIAWLVDKRARLDAEIKKTKASLAEVKRLISELSTLELEIAAIDRALGLHEIKVDVRDIHPIRSKYVRVKLPYGELSRSILLCLRLQEGAPVRMSDFVSFIEARHTDLSATPEKRSRLMRSVHASLKRMAAKGILKRHHPQNTNNEGLWTLAEQEQNPS